MQKCFSALCKYSCSSNYNSVEECLFQPCVSGDWNFNRMVNKEKYALARWDENGHFRSTCGMLSVVENQHYKNYMVAASWCGNELIGRWMEFKTNQSRKKALRGRKASANKVHLSAIMATNMLGLNRNGFRSGIRPISFNLYMCLCFSAPEYTIRS